MARDEAGIIMPTEHTITEVRITPARTVYDDDGAPVSLPRTISFRCDPVAAGQGLGGKALPHRGTVQVEPDRPGSGATMDAFLSRAVPIAADGKTMTVADILAAAGLSLEGKDGA